MPEIAGEETYRSLLSGSRYRWNTVISRTVDASIFLPPVTGSEYIKRSYTFMGFMPDGEIRDMVVGFERDVSGNITQDITYGPQDTLDVAFVYRNRSLDWLEDFDSTEKETVLAQILITDDPLKFLDNHTYQLSSADSEEADSPIVATPANMPEYLRGLWLRIRYNTDDSSATDHMLGNVANIHVTGVFGSYAADSLDLGAQGFGGLTDAEQI